MVVFSSEIHKLNHYSIILCEILWEMLTVRSDINEWKLKEIFWPCFLEEVNSGKWEAEGIQI